MPCRVNGPVGSGSEVGDIQRTSRGWHHHHALVMMVCLFLLTQRLSHEETFPLMSVRDARLLIIARLFGTDEDVETHLDQMRVRHAKRQKSIDW